mmetsp:Transcript_14157/g.39607  ORF Transcript_14157/g.39607 Transcript_14157/m.39607 type:complete len:556 (-) Transcript_14157:33-1700(-)
MWERAKRRAPMLGSVAFLVVNLALLITFALDTSALLRSTIDTAQTLQATYCDRVQPHTPKETTCLFGKKENGCDEKGLKIAVVGGGPSGLLLSHRLLLYNMRSNANHKVSLFDGRSDPRSNELEGRAYALGIGIRGRTAIRSVDENLWKAVKSRGYESERFNLHVGLPGTGERGLVIPLRTEPTTTEEKSVIEPSLLVYQSELCAALLEELEGRSYGNKDNLELHFGSKVVDCDLDSMTIDVSTASNSTKTFGPFDLIVGCDGVNSCVRTSIDQTSPEFSTTRSRLPGFFKVVRLDRSVAETAVDGNEPYDPSAVSLLIPSGAFIEPTSDDGSCCILFSGRERGEGTSSTLPVFLRERQNVTAVVEALREVFPLWREDSFQEIADQLMVQDLVSNLAYSVTCNTYHFQDKAVLVGDAAHATGGVSGQGVNSALVDAVVLADSLAQNSELGDALFEYSCLQLPEGKALYDLSFGPKPKGAKKKLLWAFRNARDTLFRGRFGIGELPLQTRLSSGLTSFADIRRERDYFYRDEEHESFPSDEEFRSQLKKLHSADTN